MPQDADMQHFERVGPSSGLTGKEGWRSGISLPSDKLYRRCDLSELRFDTVLDLPDPPGLIGQERAIEAVKFSIGIQHRGLDRKSVV